MILRDTIKKVEESRQFREWHNKNSECYLAHAFTMLDEQEKKYLWELGYYSPEKDKLTVIETEPEIHVRPEEDVFKKDGSIERLEMKRIKVSVAKAMEICDGLIKEKYSAHTITKRIILVQNMGAQVYNVTLVMRTFSILNMKIDAETGDVISHNIQSIMKLGNWEKGGRGEDENEKKEN